MSMASMVVTFIFAFALLYLLGRRLKGAHDYLFNVFSLSTLYFGVLGPMYWLWHEGGYFLGVNWSYELPTLPIIFLSVYAVFISALHFAPLLASRRLVPLLLRLRFSDAARYELVLLTIGICLALYVWLYMGDFVDVRAGRERRPLFLLALQASDVLIPLILLRVARQGITAKNVLLIAAFSLFAVSVGLRYKLVLLLVPMILISSHDERGKIRVGYLAACAAIGGLLVAAFSFMTLSRVKFSGLDLALVNELRSVDFVYGLFAESNIVFGFLSILKSYSSVDEWILLQPLLSTALEVIPRALFPEKSVSDYLQPIVIGLGGGEAYESGTAYPFFGEYYMMAGWLGVVVGIPCFVAVYGTLHRIIGTRSCTPRVAEMGFALLGTLMGYYFYSRGFMPQMAKGVLFVALPYCYYCISRKVA